MSERCEKCGAAIEHERFCFETKRRNPLNCSCMARGRHQCAAQPASPAGLPSCNCFPGEGQYHLPACPEYWRAQASQHFAAIEAAKRETVAEIVKRIRVQATLQHSSNAKDNMLLVADFIERSEG